jgi:hypothetical protein
MTKTRKAGRETPHGRDTNGIGKSMSVTISEFEEDSNWVLTSMEEQERCKWCGCTDDQRFIDPRSKLCRRCKKWSREERLALEWQRNNPHLVRKEDGLRYEYCIQFAKLCREEGQIHSWKGPITPLQLETELEVLTEQFFGKKDKIGHSLVTFAQFSSTQRRLLMYLLERMHIVSLQHRRRDIAWQLTLKEFFPNV